MYEYEYLIIFDENDEDKNEIIYVEALNDYDADDFIDNLYHGETYRKELLNKVRLR